MINILFTMIGILAIICLWIILYDSNRFVVVHHTLADSRIRRPFKVVVLADLHNKQYGKENEMLLEAIEKQSPDAVLIAGDMLTAKRGRKMKVAIDLLQKLSEKYPVFYANGNHEYRLELYPDVYGSMAQDYENALKEAGIDRLINQHVVLKQAGIAIYGLQIDREYYRRFQELKMSPDYLDKLLGKPDEQLFCILLAHNPDYFPQYAKWGADLVLSGHVHGGLVRIPGGKGILSPKISFFPKYDGGMFEEGNAVMLLSRGLGLHTLPVRFFNPGELLVVDLNPKEDVRGENDGNTCEA